MSPAGTPNPGSPAAVAVGCTCPTVDNAHGRGAHGTTGALAMYIQDLACPVHGVKATQDGDQ